MKKLEKMKTVKDTAKTVFDAHDYFSTDGPSPKAAVESLIMKLASNIQ